jgi:hypothetical protein
MAEQALVLAKRRGYRAMMFNLVYTSNIASLKLWDSMGFQRIGVVPQAGCDPHSGAFVDAVQFYKSLVDSNGIVYDP